MSTQEPLNTDKKIIVSVLPAGSLSQAVQDAICTLHRESLGFYATDKISAAKISEVFKVFEIPAKSVRTTEESPRSSAPA
jgi:hypothetical protein